MGQSSLLSCIYQPGWQKRLSEMLQAGKVAHAFGLRWKVSDELRVVEEGCGGSRGLQ